VRAGRRCVCVRARMCVVGVAVRVCACAFACVDSCFSSLPPQGRVGRSPRPRHPRGVRHRLRRRPRGRRPRRRALPLPELRRLREQSPPRCRRRPVRPRRRVLLRLRHQRAAGRAVRGGIHPGPGLGRPRQVRGVAHVARVGDVLPATAPGQRTAGDGRGRERAGGGAGRGRDAELRVGDVREVPDEAPGGARGEELRR
jgi:hypothetical protein